MNRNDAFVSLWKLDFTAGMSQTYYRWLANRCMMADRTLKIALGLATVFSFSITFANAKSYLSPEFLLAGFSMVAAVSLSIIPIDKRESRFRVMLARWREFQSDLQTIEIETFGRILDADFVVEHKGMLSGDVSQETVRNIQRVTEKKQAISTDEKFDVDYIESLARKAEFVRRWGKGIENREQALAEIERRREAMAKSGSGANAAAVA
jgi:hypothetical protein